VGMRLSKTIKIFIFQYFTVLINDRIPHRNSITRKVKLLFSNKITATLILRIARIAWDERGNRIFDIENQEKPLRAEISDRSRCIPGAVFH